MVDHGNIYACGFPDNYNDDAFRQLFEQYGAIVSCKYFMDKRHGFVKFGSAQEATAVIGAMNGFEVNGAQIIVRLANNDRGAGKGNGVGKGAGGDGGYSSYTNGQSQAWGVYDGIDPSPCDNLYVTGLPPSFTEEHINAIFGAYGLVQSCKVLNPNGKGQDGGIMSIAMIRMGGVDQASWLVQNLNGNIPQGLATPIQVRFADPPGVKAQRYAMKGGDMGKGPGKVGKGGSAYSIGNYNEGGGGNGTNLYIKGLPQIADDLFLYQTFAPFGAIHSVRTIMAENFCSGIGFVLFVNADDAQRSIADLNGWPLPDGTSLHVSVKTQKRNA